MALNVGLDAEMLVQVAERALAEDLGHGGDITTEAVIDPGVICVAALELRQPGVLCGLDAAAAVFHAVEPAIRFTALAGDGDLFDDAPATVARIEGRARAVLTAERTALNLVGHLSGVATLTRSYVERVGGTSAAILDTRKTTPGLRVLEKWAVRCGGGSNHRLGLHDGILVKDNHIRLAGGIADAVRLARAHAPGHEIEVETETLADVQEALSAGADAILLDNMTLETMSAAVEMVAGRARLEASGGVNLLNVHAIAATGVDSISIGALTHSAPSLDVALEME